MKSIFHTRSDAASGKLKRRIILSILILTCANLVFFLTLWLSSKYDNVQLDQVLYQMKSSSKGSPGSLLSSVWIRVVLFGVVLTVVEVVLYYFLAKRINDPVHTSKVWLKRTFEKAFCFCRKRGIAMLCTLLTMSVLLFVIRLDVIAYVSNNVTESDFIEENYVEPEASLLAFPEEKRNLIYIFLESMENTYAQTVASGPITDNFIPELSQLADDNINFSNTSGLGGALSFNGTTWTAASLVSQTSGLIVKVPLNADDYNGEDAYMPGVVSLGDILAEQGYRQVLLFGSDAEFASRDSYFTEHGGYEILDTIALKEAGKLEEDYFEWWGFEDEKLFAYAKEMLAELAQGDQPFNFTMLTADTHFPDGYECELCGDVYEDQYANVLSCSSSQIYEFILWIQQQPFYENTTIVISGDHLTMDPNFLDGIDENYVRTVYNCIINAPIEPVQEKNRLFGVYDMFPTTLAAMGVEIEGNRLGLGTNLFSAEKTLTETYGYEALNEELQKHSAYYNTKLLDDE